LNAPRNIVGPQIRALREKKGWTQPVLVARLNLAGWQISRETLAKIEAQIRWVSDFELLCLVEVLGIKLEEAYPSRKRSELLKSVFSSTP
jgi:transcriptional regulator with XRE-family HTH domain